MKSQIHENTLKTIGKMNKETKLMKSIISGIFAIVFIANSNAQKINNNMKTKQEQLNTIDNSKKSILARGCDPELSLRFSKVVPPLIGNATYVPTTDDTDFINKLKSGKWSVIYFAPGACRYSAAKQQIPGGNYDTQGWTLDQYKILIHELQGEAIQIVESIYEQGAIELLNKALEKAPEVK